MRPILIMFHIIYAGYGLVSCLGTVYGCERMKKEIMRKKGKIWNKLSLCAEGCVCVLR